jgi:hypothetical protein
MDGLRQLVVAAALAGVLTGWACAQSVPAQSVTSNPMASSSSSPNSDSSGLTTSTPVKTRPPVTDSDENAVDPASLLPDLPSLKHTGASLIGGTVQKVDRVRDELTLRIFGGGKMKIYYDPRTHILQGDGQGAATDVRVGDRVYVDTVLDGSDIFARNIRLAATGVGGRTQGAVVSYDPTRGELLVRDALSPVPVRLHIDSRTEILQAGHAASASDLVPGTLVDVDFASQKSERDAEQVSILAVPGSDFTFSGEVTSLDLHLGLLVMKSETDHKTYEIFLDPANVTVDDRVRPGADVTAQTNFDGTKYIAKSVTLIGK